MTLETRHCDLKSCTRPFRVLPTSEQRFCGRGCESWAGGSGGLGESWRPKRVDEAMRNRLHQRLRELCRQTPPPTYARMVEIVNGEGIRSATGRPLKISNIGLICAQLGFARVKWEEM